MRIWAKNYPNDFTPASRKAILDALGKENVAPALLNEFKLLFLKRKCLVPSTGAAAGGSSAGGTNTTASGTTDGSNGSGIGSRGSGIRTLHNGSLTARDYNLSTADGIRPLISPSGSLTARERSTRTIGSEAEFSSTSTSRSDVPSLASSNSSERQSSSLDRKGGIPPSFSGSSLDKFLSSRPSGKKKRSATIDGGPLPDIVAELMSERTRAAALPSSSAPSLTLTSSQSSFQTPQPLSPRHSEKRRLSKDNAHSLSANNVRSVMNVPSSILTKFERKTKST